MQSHVIFIMVVINCTSTPVVLVHADGYEIELPALGGAPVVTFQRSTAGIDGMTPAAQIQGVLHLPDPKPDTHLLVDPIVVIALPERFDLLLPGTLLRVDDMHRAYYENFVVPPRRAQPRPVPPAHYAAQSAVALIDTVADAMGEDDLDLAMDGMTDLLALYRPALEELVSTAEVYGAVIASIDDLHADYQAFSARHSATAAATATATAAATATASVETGQTGLANGVDAVDAAAAPTNATATTTATATTSTAETATPAETAETATTTATAAISTAETATPADTAETTVPAAPDAPTSGCEAAGNSITSTASTAASTFPGGPDPCGFFRGFH